ncbi:conserved hypothetical protein [Neospora caninum Liverpool]|uniref:Uncharacterized protein n=1 Tax=Neospora caninum (strain Liverpool) TaxID=572307 RepID=F0VQ01_NEOCL|nr:conserved hypothetical protein [Neospora caninum Liverpool]CBZ55798.1 conserved hypothetical protein [Neospora caninum Liverpool]CEL70540.1 TPA: hypothetical protein BN1204_062240 [Neospora caninum Liverpool]|eukprot:XP_003885824.1 conserved hypothetical protein [Neospora caninum Liverpool]
MRRVRILWMSAARRSVEGTCRTTLDTSRPSVPTRDCRRLSSLAACHAASQADEVHASGSEDARRFYQAALSPAPRKADGRFTGECAFEAHARPSMRQGRICVGSEGEDRRGPSALETRGGRSLPHLAHAENEAGVCVPTATRGRQRGTRIRLRQLDFHSAVRRSRSVEGVLEICAQFLREIKDELGDCCARDASRHAKRPRCSRTTRQLRDQLSGDPSNPTPDAVKAVETPSCPRPDVSDSASPREAAGERRPSSERRSDVCQLLPLSDSSPCSHTDASRDAKAFVARTARFPFSPHRLSVADPASAPSSPCVSSHVSPGFLGPTVCPHVAADLGWINSAHVLHRLALLHADASESSRRKAVPNASTQQTRGSRAGQESRRARVGSRDDNEVVDSPEKLQRGGVAGSPSGVEGSGVQAASEPGAAGLSATRSGDTKAAEDLLRDTRFLSVLGCVLHHLRQVHEALLESENCPSARGIREENAVSNLQSVNLGRPVSWRPNIRSPHAHPPPGPVPLRDGESPGDRQHGPHALPKTGTAYKESSPVWSAFSRACAAIGDQIFVKDSVQVVTPLVRVSLPSSHSRRDEASPRAAPSGEGSSGTCPRVLLANLPIPHALHGAASTAGKADDPAVLAAEATASAPRAAVAAEPGCARFPPPRALANAQQLRERVHCDAAPCEQTRGEGGWLPARPGSVARDGSGKTETRGPTAAQLRFIASLCWACGKLRLPGALGAHSVELHSSTGTARSGALPAFSGMSAAGSNGNAPSAKDGDASRSGLEPSSSTTGRRRPVPRAEPSESGGSASSPGVQPGPSGCTRPLASDGARPVAAAPALDKQQADLMVGRRLCSEMFCLLENCVVRCLPFFRPRELSLGLWGVAQCHAATAGPSGPEDGRGRGTTRVRENFWRQAVEGIRRRLPELPLRELAMLAQTCCTVGYRNEALMGAVADAMLRCLPREWEQSRGRPTSSRSHKTGRPLAASEPCRARQQAAAWGRLPKGVSGASTEIVDVDTRHVRQREDILGGPNGAQKHTPSRSGEADVGPLDDAAATTLGANVSVLLQSFAALAVPVPNSFRAVAALLLDDRDSMAETVDGDVRRTSPGPAELAPRRQITHGVQKSAEREGRGDLAPPPAAPTRDVSGVARSCANSHLSSPHSLGPFLASLEPSHVTSLAWAFSAFLAGSARGNAVGRAQRCGARADLGGCEGAAHRTSLVKQSRDDSADEAHCRVVSEAKESLTALSVAPFGCASGRDATHERPFSLSLQNGRRGEQQLFSELSSYLASHAHCYGRRYSTAEKVQLCWALALQDIYMPTFLCSALTALERASRRPKGMRIRSAVGRFPLPADRGAGVGESGVSKSTVSRGENLNACTPEGPCSTPFSRLLDVEPLDDSLLPHKLQTQLYLSTLCFLTRGDTSLVFGSARDWGRHSPVNEGVSSQSDAGFERQSQLPRPATDVAHTVNESRSCSAFHQGAIEKIVPPVEKLGQVRTGKSKDLSVTRPRCGLARALERARVKQISLPTAFFRCRAALDTHPDRTPHYVVSPLHIKVLIELRKILHTREEIREQPTCILLEGVFAPQSVVGKLAEKHKEKETPGASVRKKAAATWDIVPEYRDSSGIWVDIVARPRAPESSA